MLVDYALLKTYLESPLGFGVQNGGSLINSNLFPRFESRMTLVGVFKKTSSCRPTKVLRW